MDILGIILTVLSSITMTLSLIAVTLIHLVVYLLPILFLYWCLPTLWKKIDDLIFDYTQKRKHKIWNKFSKEEKKGKKNPFRGKSFTCESWTEERKKEKEYKKKHPIKTWLCDTYNTLASLLWYRVPSYPYDIKWYIKRTWQRARRGWADSDTWGFQAYLSEVIRDGCKLLVKTKQGIPMSAFPEDAEVDKTGNHTDAAFDDACKGWDVILQKIIKTFDTAEHIGEYHWFYQKSEKYSRADADRQININKKHREEDPDLWEKEALHVMTLEECKEYEEGWKLFQEHFFGLWD